MKYSKPPFWAQIIPFISFGIFLVLAVIGIIFLSYILLAGAVIGLVLFVISFIRMKFFPPKNITPTEKHNRGQTYDHDEFK